MFVIGKIIAVNESSVTIQRQFPFRVVKSMFVINNTFNLTVGDVIRGARNGDELCDIEQIMVDTCVRCGAQFELLNAQYIDYPIPSCCSALSTPLREQVQLREIYYRDEEYQLHLENLNGKSFITNWISKNDFLADVDANLELEKGYNIVAWVENEHGFVDGILMDMIELVDIELYK